MVQVDSDTYDLLKSLNMASLPGVKQAQVRKSPALFFLYACAMFCLMDIIAMAGLCSACVPARSAPSMAKQLITVE